MLWQYSYDPDNISWPCEWGPCWSPYVNGWGPNPQSEAYHIIGVGSGYWFSQQFIDPWAQPEYVSHTTYIPYFKKNGLSCGTELFVGMSETAEQDRLIIEPNPSTGPVRIRAAVPVIKADVLDLHGRSVHRTTLSGLSIDLDLTYLPVGVYVVQVRFKGGAQGAKKLVLSR